MRLADTANSPVPAGLPPREEAKRLAAIWNRISRQHLAAGQGCACGVGGLVLQGSSFELDIVEFLLDAAARDGFPGIAFFVEKVARRGAESYSLLALLDAIGATAERTLPRADEVSFILQKLNATLTGMDSSHERSRFNCA